MLHYRYKGGSRYWYCTYYETLVYRIKSSKVLNICFALADVTSICVSRKGDQVCAGSADMSLKVINRETFKDVLLEGHTAPILVKSNNDN